MKSNKFIISLSNFLKRQAGSWNVHLAALFTALMGFINVLSAVTPTLSDRLVILENFSPLIVRHSGRLTTALAGFALLLLASNLWRRKHNAWLLTLIVLVLSAISHLIKGLDYEEAILAALLAFWLWMIRSQFHARSDPPSVKQGLYVLLSAIFFTLAYGVIGFYLLDHHYSINFGLWAAMRQTVIMFTQFYDPGLQPVTRFGRYFVDSIYLIAGFTSSYALFMVVRPVFLRTPSTLEERKKAQIIVSTYAQSSLARFTLLNDKTYFFSPGGSMIAYVVKGRVAVALGDPIGPEEDIPIIINEFKRLCSQNDWSPIFYQTLPNYLNIYRVSGFQNLCIGHEGIVDLASFTLEGGVNKDMRTAVNRMNRLNYHAEVLNPPLEDTVLSELRDISDEWLTNMHGSEKRFSLGAFEDNYVRNCPVVIITDPDGHITAFANILHAYQRNEATIDLMRRKNHIEPGSMDFLFASLLQWAQKQGYRTFNLGLSALSGVGEHPEDPALERTLHYIYEHVNQFYNFKGLHSFKEKFHPTWSPRYLVYPSPISLPNAFTALIRADSGENFIMDYLKDFLRK